MGRDCATASTTSSSSSGCCTGLILEVDLASSLDRSSTVASLTAVSKSTSRINPVQQPEEEEDVVEAVAQSRPKKFVPQGQRNRNQQQQRQAPRPQHQSNNYRNNQQWRPNNPGNNSNRNNKTCSFCRRMGHRQEECRQRMNANQPCIDANGKTFWPKINTTDAGAPIQSLQDQDFQF